MKNSRSLKVILIVSGLIAVTIGGAILLVPEIFYSMNGIELRGNISLLNEVRAPGGALLVIGLLIALGAFITELTFTSIIVSTLIYLSYGTSRIASMLTDGKPADALVQAAALEITVGLFSAFALFKYRKLSNKSPNVATY